MPQATLSSLGARVLRKLGVQMVPVSQNAVSATTFTHQTLATMALRKSGAQIVPVSQQAISTTTVPSATIATQALRQMGAQIVPAGTESVTTTFDSSILAARAVRELGIIIPEANWPGADPAVSHTEIATRALRAVGINPISANANQSNVNTVYSVTEVAARALRAVGINPAGPIQSTDTALADTNLMAITVLQRLGVVDPSETPAAIDVTYVTNQFTQLNATLVRNGVVTWTTAAVPERAMNAYLLMLTYLCAGAFGKPADVSLYNDGEQSLRTQALSGQDGQQRAEAVALAVHDGLAARNIVGWPSTNIPDYALNSYVTLTALMLVPVHAQIASTNTTASATTREQLVANEDAAGAHAEQALRRMSLSGIYGQAIANDKVVEVHDYLTSLGLVSWGIDAIPASRIASYVGMTAALLWPIMSEGPRDAQDRQIDQAAWDAGEEQARKAGRVDGALQLASDRIAAVQDELVADGLASWPLTAIPQSVADAYVALTMQSLQGSFGGKFDADAYSASKLRVRVVAMGGAAGVALAQQKVAAIHEEAVADGFVAWTVSTIPLAASEAYTDATVQALAPAFEQKFDADAMAAALKRIRLVAMGGATAQALAEQQVAATHDEAVANGLASWTMDAVPLAASGAYVDAAVSLLAPQFAQKPDPEGYGAALKRIRAIAMGGAAGQALAEQKVLAVHAQLDAEGLTRWSLYDLPDYVEEPYVLMASALLAPEWDKPVDPKWTQAGLAMIQRSTSLPSLGDPVHAVYF